MPNRDEIAPLPRTERFANFVVSFRPGETFGRYLQDRAIALDVAINEFAKRLAIMVSCGFEMSHYPELSELADIASQDGSEQAFSAACSFVRKTIKQSKPQECERLPAEYEHGILRNVLAATKVARESAEPEA